MVSSVQCTLLLGLIWIVATKSNNNHITITSVQENKDKNLLVGILTELDISNEFPFSKLTNPSIIQIPQTNSNNWQFEITFANDNHECITDPNRLYCDEKFMISSANNNKNCPLHLKGQFEIQFDVINTNTNDIYDTITLNTEITYEDSICDSQIFNIDENDIKSQLIETQEMKFYQDENYQVEMDPNDLYKPNEICFAEVIMHYNKFNGLFVNSLLQNVWICTSGIEINIDECDAESYYWIIKNHEEEESLLDAKIISETDYPDSKTTVIRFAFTIPTTIQTDSLYIENQVSLQIMQNNEKRLLLNSDTNGINSILRTLTVYVFGYIHIDNNIIYPYRAYPENKLLFIGKEWVIILEILTVILILLALILIVVYCNCDNNHQIESRNENQNEDNIPLKGIDKDVVDFEDFEHEYNDPLDGSY